MRFYFFILTSKQEEMVYIAGTIKLVIQSPHKTVNYSRQAKENTDIVITLYSSKYAQLLYAHRAICLICMQI